MLFPSTCTKPAVPDMSEITARLRRYATDLALATRGSPRSPHLFRTTNAGARDLGKAKPFGSTLVSEISSGVPSRPNRRAWSEGLTVSTNM
jgi:hypothetical protein